MLVETNSDGTATVIRSGNTGMADNLPRLASACHGVAPQKRAQARPRAMAAK
jgi:hypothetical protein